MEWEEPNPLNALFLQKQYHYRGRAKIFLHHLEFEDENVAGGRTVDPKNIARLVRVFESEGCLRLEAEHHIPALIGETLLGGLLRDSSITQAALLDFRQDPPYLHLADGQQLVALHGKHRIKAAEKFLDPFDRWWVVDFYNSSLPEDAVLDIRTEYSNARGFSDGDVFRHLRHYQLTGDFAQVGRWKARTTPRKFRHVKQLVSQYDAMSKAFDDLLPFTGLWAPVQLGCLSRILTMNCEEELGRYLRHIRHVWLDIVGEPDAAALLDSKTVHSLELMAPMHSTRDKSTITAAMEAGELFPNVRDRVVRAAIFGRILRVRGRIPSLFSFFEDTKYLEPCATIIKGLLPRGLKHSVERAFRKRFVRYCRDGRASVEARKDTWIEVAATPRQASRIAYLSLWLFTMRQFPLMHKLNPRKDSGKMTPQYKLREDLWPLFARLASQLGFESPEILRFKSQDPFERVVKAFLLSTTPQDEYDIDPAAMRMEIWRICQYLSSVPRRSLRARTPSIVTDRPEQPPAHRCGVPFNSHYLENRPYVYLQYIYSDRGEDMGSHLSRFGIERDIFRAFFGDLPTDAELSWPPESDPLRGPPPSAPPQALDETRLLNEQRSTPPAQSPSSTVSWRETSLSPGLASLEEPPTTERASLRNTSSDAREIDEFSAIAVPTASSLHISQMPDLLTWLLTVPEGHRSMVYYDLNVGRIFALAEEEVNRNSELINQNLLGLTYYVCGIDSNGGVFLSPNQILYQNSYRLRFFGRRGTPPGRDSMAHAWQLIHSYFPNLDIEDSLLQMIADIDGPS